MLNPDVVERIRELQQRSVHPIERSSAAQIVHDKPRKHRSENSKLPAGREVTTPVGQHWLVERKLTDIWQSLQGNSDLNRADSGEAPDHSELRALNSAFPEKTLFLDLETCGFAGSMAFLVGLILHETHQFILCQLLARNYAEEKAVMYSLWQLARDRTTLITFNGKSFDWPVIKDRTVLHRLTSYSHVNSLDSFPVVHCDILHHARRFWKDKLPNCKLQTLERHVCGRRRAGDIPGQEIPAAYHDFVRTNDARIVKLIMHHNAIDLVTLFELSMNLTDSPILFGTKRTREVAKPGMSA